MADPFYITLAASLAIHFCENLLDATTRRVREKFSGDARKQALTSALREGLENSFAAFHLEDVDQDHFSTLFEKFIDQQNVVDEFAHLIDPRPNTPLDVELLRNEFNSLGFDDKTLAIFSFDPFIQQFGEEFYNAAAKQRELQGTIEIQLLHETIAQLGSINTHTERTAIAVEQTAAAADEISDLTERLLLGQAKMTELSAAMEQVATKGFEQVFVLLEKMLMALSKSGFGITINDVNNGNVIIGDSNRLENNVNRNTLEELQVEINRLRQNVISQEPSPETLQVIEKRYRQHIITWFEHLTFQGMMRTAQAISLPLEDVYVELRAVGEVPEAADTFSVEERRLLLEVKDEDEGAKQELLRHMDTLRRERWSRTTTVERKSISETLFKQDQRAFVILGDPGSGKSTLLHFLALVYARGAEAIQQKLKAPMQEVNRLPIFVPLAAFDDMLRTHPGLTLLEFLPIYFDRRRLIPGLAPLFQRALESGNALVLFDGLDEVLDATTRRYVANQVTAMMNEYAPRGVRFAMTSRFVGYREAPISGDVPHLSVLDFGTEEIKTFVHQWSHTYETWVQGGKESLESTRAAHQLEKDLLEDVNSISSVRRLAANPLMLTMLALLRRQVGKLPHRRIELYKRYMDTMIDNWVEARTAGEREHAIKISDPHQAESLLIPLAYWLQSSQPSGTASKAVIQNALTDICLREEGFDSDSVPRLKRKEAEEHARKFLLEMRNMSGLIVERGNDAFGFLHLTFQEYFAGRALAQMKAEDRWDAISPHLHDPRWREPILLCAGQLGIVEKRRADVSDFVRNIFQHEDSTEKDLHRNLLLVLSIAGDDVNLEPALIHELANQAVECLPTKVYTFANELINKLGQLVANDTAKAEICFSKIWDEQDSQLHTAAIKALETHLGNAAIREQILICLDDENWQVRISAVSALATLIAPDQVVRDKILKCLDDDENWQVRTSAVSALLPLITSDQEVHDQILKCFDDENEYMRRSVVNTLEPLVASDQVVREQILKCLDDPNELVRNAAVSALTTLVASDQEIRDQILKRLEDPGSDVYSAAVNALITLVASDQEIRDQILKRLDDQNEWVRRSVVSALAPLVASDTEVRDQILKCLDDQNEWVRRSVVSALAPLVASDTEVRDQILKRLDDQNEWVRSAAVSALAALVASDKVVLDRLEIQATEGDWQIRKSTVEALAQSLHHPRLVAPITEILDNSLNILLVEKENPFIREAIPALKHLIASDQEVRAQILKCLNNPDSGVRSAAVSALASLVASDTEVRDQILKCLDDESEYVRRSVSSALAPLAASDQEVRAQILKRLDDPDSDVRSAAVSALAPLAASDQEVRAQILKRLDDPDSDVRSAAVSAFAPLAASDQEVRAQILKCLDDPDSDVRSAAVSALLSLGVTEQELERLMEGNWRISAAWLEFLANIYYLQLKVPATKLPEASSDILRFLKQLNDENEDVQRFLFGFLASLATSDQEVRAQILKRLDKENWDVRSSAVNALATFIAPGQEVHDQPFKRLDSKIANLRLFVFSTLASLAATDAEVREQTLKHLDNENENVRSSAVSALAPLATSDKEVRDQILKHLVDQNGSVRRIAFETLYSSASEYKTITLDEIRDFLLSEFSDVSLIGISEVNRNRNQEMRKHLAGHLTKEYLLPLLKNPSWKIRLEATLLLLNRYPHPHQEIIDRILKCMDDKRGLESFPARLSAASYLINRDAYSAHAIQVCLDALKYGTGKWDYLPESGEIRKQAALILGTLEPVRYDQRVYDQLYKSMTSDEDAKVRDTAYGTLVKLARAKEFKQ